MPHLPLAQPMDWFALWMDEAQASQEPEPTAMSLSTVDKRGHPTVRIVLLKAYDSKGFVFYTNLNSAKGRHLIHNPVAGLCFMWKELGRQVRIDGAVEPVTEKEADAYFASRSRGSQIGAWASRQSAPLESRESLAAVVEEMEHRFDGKDVPRPGFWSGFRVIPETFEFWQLRLDRLHDRWRFDRDVDEQWVRQRLYP